MLNQADIEAIRRAVDVKADGRGDVRCPVHDDKNASCSINLGRDGRIVCHCHAGCDQRDVFDAVVSIAGHLMPTQAPIVKQREWVYTDADGVPLAKVVRSDTADGKRIFQQSFKDGQWLNRGLSGETPLYDLPGLLESRLPVLIVEGEKARDAAAKSLSGQIVATCWLGGVNKVERVNLDALEGRDVILWPDADAPGQAAMQRLTQRLQGVAGSIRTLDVSGLPEKADAADVIWTADEFWKRVQKIERANALPLVHVDDIGDTQEDLDEIVEDVLTVGAFSVVFGESNSGKSFLVTNMDAAIGSNGKWLGKRVEPGCVLYVAGEGAASIKRRFKAHKDYFGLPSIRVTVVPIAINLFDAQADVQRVIDAAKEVQLHHGVPLRKITIDTLARAMGGGNENTAEDMGVVIANADKIRAATGAHVQFIHHSGKDASKGARGSGALRAATDTEIEVTGDSETKLHTAEVTKQRDLSSVGERLTGKFEVVRIGTNKWDKPITTCVVVETDETHEKKPRARPNTRESTVLAILEGVETSIRIADLARQTEAFGIKRNALYAVLGKLEESGLVTKVGTQVALTKGV